MLGPRPGLANENTTSSYSSDWARKSSWPNKNRISPGTTGKEVLFSQRYIATILAGSFEWAILLQLLKALSENQINTKGRRTKRGKDRFLMTCLKHLEPAVPEENSKTGLHNKSQ